MSKLSPKRTVVASRLLTSAQHPAGGHDQPQPTVTATSLIVETATASDLSVS